MAAPTIVQPSMAGEIGQAASQFPLEKQQYDIQQANLDATNLDNSTKRLAVLTKMFSVAPGAAQNQQLVAATQRAFQGMGLSAPMKSVNGVQQLDVDALSAFGPAMDFMSSNLSTILSLPANSRAATIEAITGQQLSPELEQKLSSLPQRTMTSNDLGPLLTTVRQSILSLDKPGGSIDNVIATMKTVQPLLRQLGTDISVDDFAPDIYAMELEKANLNHLDATTAKANADADLAKARAAIQPDLGQAALDKGQAALEQGSAAETRAKSYASRAPAEIAKDYAAAAKDRADVQDLLGTSPGTGKAAEQHMQRLTTIANNSQALYERLLNDYTTVMATANSSSATPEDRAAAKKQGDEIHQRMADAHIAATRAQHALEDYQSKTSQGTTHHAPAGAPTKTLPDGTVVYKGKDGKAYDDATGQLYHP